MDRDVEMAISEDEDEDERMKQETKTPLTPLDQLSITEGLKRKRDEDGHPEMIGEEDCVSTPSKLLKSETPPPPPPPPPPPTSPQPREIYLLPNGI